MMDEYGDEKQEEEHSEWHHQQPNGGGDQQWQNMVLKENLQNEKKHFNTSYNLKINKFLSNKNLIQVQHVKSRGFICLFLNKIHE
jgi:hypothetical protein